MSESNGHAYVPPDLPTATIEDDAVVAALGGPVELRGFTLSQRLAFGRLLGNLANGADVHADDLFVSHLLARTVYRDGKPLMSVDEWERFGGTHLPACMDLFWQAWRMCGFDGAAHAGN